MASLPAESILPACIKPWTQTPCVLNGQLSKIAGCNIWLKLDNLQPSGSFKSRGIGNLMRLEALERDATGRAMHFYSSSGGNAGLACACAAVSLSAPCTIVVPEPTKPMMVEKLRALGANVVQTGSSWFEADQHLRTLLKEDPDGVYVPPFDDPRIWAGASTLVDELVHDLADQSVDVHAIICAVGGGGLLNGIVQGIEKHATVGAWRGPSPTIIAVETRGADSLNASVRAGEHVSLPSITSIATSLGALRVCNQTWEYVKRGVVPEVYSNGNSNGHSKGHSNGNSNGHAKKSSSSSGSGAIRLPNGKPNIASLVVSDGDAARAVVRFADDARMLVEVSCGAALATVYGANDEKGLSTLRSTLGGRMSDEQWAKTNVVIVVCGGSAVSLAMIEEYRHSYGF